MKKALLLLLFFHLIYSPIVAKNLKIGMALEPPHLDPTAGAAGAIDEIVYSNIFEGLVELNSKGIVKPLLAKKWTVSKDKKTYAFALENNVLFHDGKTFEAEDVVFSLNRIIAKNSVNAQKKLYLPIKSVIALNKSKVEIKLKFPYRNFLYYLAWGDAVIVNSKNYQNNKTHPIGTGAFKFKKWIRGNRIELIKNIDYRNKKVFLEKASFLFIPDPTAALHSLLTKEINAYPNFPSPENIPILKKNGNFKIVIGNTEGETLVAINNAKEPFSNFKVRLALQHTINRQEIIQGALFGYAIPIGSHFSPNHKDYLDLSNHYKTDINKAKKLLKEAGYPNGFKTTLKLPPPIYAKRSGEILASQLKKIGIELKIIPVEWGQWLQDVFKNKKYDLTIIAHTEPYDFNIYARENYYFNYKNDDFNQLIYKLERSFDNKEITLLHHQIIQKITDDAVNLFLFQLPKIGIWNKNIDGLWKNSPIQATVIKDVTF